jgi:hypothetical protein
MQQHERWRSLLGVLVLGIALSLTWSVEVAVQNGGAAGSNGADRDYNEHRVPGDVWRFEAWPSHMQRGYLKQLANDDPPLYAAWSKRLNQAIAHKQLDKRTELVVVVAMDAMVHWAPPGHRATRGRRV